MLYYDLISTLVLGKEDMKHPIHNMKIKLSWWRLSNEVEQYGFWSTSDKLLSSFLGQFVYMHQRVHMLKTMEYKVNYGKRMFEEVKYYFKLLYQLN